jgi:flap endonuclease-1
MGIDNFFKIKNTNKKSEFYGKTIGEMGREVKLKDVEGRLAVDASHSIYSSILAMERIASLSGADGDTTVHLNTILNKAIQLAVAGKDQVWIFDSPLPNELKKIELAKRAARRETAAEKGYANSEKVAYKLNTKHVEEVKTLLKLLGIMTIQAPAGVESEQLGAFMTKGDDPFCTYMISADSDVLGFGGNLLKISSVKSSTGKSSKTVYRIYELSTILSELDVTYDQFLQMCVMLGTDFNEKTPRIGPAKIVNEVKTMDIFLEPAQEKVVTYFKSDVPIGDSEMTQESYNKEALIEFLVSKNFKRERLEKILEKYKPPKAPKN